MSKERLVELIKRDNCQYPCLCSSKCKYVDEDDCHSERLADLILADGWIRLPCKVGDVVYRISSKTSISENKVYQLIFTEEGLYYLDDEYRESSDVVFGKTVFLTREEAEAKLREGAE